MYLLYMFNNNIIVYFSGCVSRGVAFRGLSSPAHHSVLMTATPTQSYSSNSSSSSSDDPRQRAKRLSALTGEKRVYSTCSFTIIMPIMLACIRSYKTQFLIVSGHDYIVKAPFLTTP